MLKIDIIPTLAVLVIFNIFNIFVLYGRFYSFKYNNNTIYIIHMWSTKIEKYSFNELEGIELKKIPQIGKVIVIRQSSGKKNGYGASVIDNDLLEEMVSEITESIENNKVNN